MYNHTLHREIKHFCCCCCLQAFSTIEILKNHVNDCIKINSKQIIKLKDKYVTFKNYKKRIKSTFKNYTNFKECFSAKR